jgi:hypothetical protein
MDITNVLPHELFTLVVSYAVERVADVRALLLVSREWHRQIHDNQSIWHSLATRMLPFFDWDRSHLIQHAPGCTASTMYFGRDMMNLVASWQQWYAHGDVFDGTVSYRDALQQTLAGKRFCFAQVYDRNMFSNGGGTQLSAYDALIHRVSLEQVQSNEQLANRWFVFYLGTRARIHDNNDNDNDNPNHNDNNNNNNNNNNDTNNNSTTNDDQQCFGHDDPIMSSKQQSLINNPNNIAPRYRCRLNLESEIVDASRLRAIPLNVRDEYCPFNCYYTTHWTQLSVGQEVELQFRFSPDRPFGMCCKQHELRARALTTTLLIH